MTETFYLTNKDLQKREDSLLAPYAMRSSKAKRRYPIPGEGREHNFRTQYQRDRDRIVHSRAFRRLKHKTQVFAPHDGDHQRTRLTHTIEVAQISRTIARTLQLNEDLTEAIALAHDLGHTPFGHSGEKILNRIMRGEDDLGCLPIEILKKAGGGYKHNYQSLRVVDTLEKRYAQHDGINLTSETREGILKHTNWKSDQENQDMISEDLNFDLPNHIEGQVVAVADEIAQVTHDLEDGIRANEVSKTKMEKLAISDQVIKHLASRYSETPSSFEKQNMLIRGIIHLLVTNIVLASGKKLADWAEGNQIKSSKDFYANRSKVEPVLIGFNEEGQKLYSELRDFVLKWIINSFRVNRADGRARYFLRKLFRAYYTNPLQLNDYLLIRFKERAKVRYLRDVSVEEQEGELNKNYYHNPLFIRMICDHIAGMSDAYALREFEKLFIPYQLSSTSTY